jgi:nitrile hydratase
MDYALGSRVRIKLDWPEARGPAHIRTPHYVRGHEGVVRARLGSFPFPEDLAFNRPAAKTALYHVAFDPRKIWPDGVSADEVLVEIFAPWLEAA